MHTLTVQVSSVFPLNCQIEEFRVKNLLKKLIVRKLHERGYHNIKGMGEITTIEEFRERAFAIQHRSRKQTLDDVSTLRKKYEQPIIGEVSVERLLELLRKSSIPQMFVFIAEAS